MQNNAKVSFVFVVLKRPPRVWEYAVGYAWRDAKIAVLFRNIST
jgi:hypothetical protein